MTRRLFITLLLAAMTFGLQAGDPLKTLKIVVDTPREMFLDDPAGNGRKPFWVVTFRIENTTGEDRELALRAYLESDYKRLDQEFARSVGELNAPLQRIVQQKDGRVYKNTVELSANPFRRGEVVDGILIFPRPPRRSDNVTLFIDGLSGVTVVKETKKHLEELRKDHVEIVKPETIIWEKRPETRFRTFTDEDIEGAEDVTYRERKVFKKTFIREGDEFHVHEDDIRPSGHALNDWILVLDQGSR